MSKFGEEVNKLKGELKRYKDELKQLVKRRNEYLTVSAHQMKSPLSTISFSLDTLIGEYAGTLTSKQLRIIESIKRSANTLQDLIRDILELERLRIGKVEIERVDFLEICMQSIEELNEYMQEKDIYFEINLPHKILFTKGHKIGLKQVVCNLLENAVKYSNRNSKVSFTVEYDEAEKTVTGIVKDQGIGIPEDEQGHIFEEFYRAQNARRFDRTGTGFGMVIVKHVLDFCGGRIKLSSKENEGTRITFSLPLIEIKDREISLQKEMMQRKKIVVIGGAVAGPKAASRARRLDSNAKITVFEKGYFLAYAGCALPYYVSGQIKNQKDLSVAITGFQGANEFFRSVKGIEIKNRCEVIKIDRTGKIVQYKDQAMNQVFSIPYDTLIVATGSTPIIPDIKGVNLLNIFVLHGIHDSEKIKHALANDMAKNIVIIGGGLIGVEIAEALTVSGARVTIIEKENQILSFLDTEMAVLVEKHMEHKGIRIIKNEVVSAFFGEKRVEYVQLSNLKLSTDLVILAVGIKPNIKLAKQAGLKLGSTGAIAVNEYLQTSDPSIFAAGDCAETFHAVLKKPYYLPLGSIANRAGRIAGTNAIGIRNKFSAVSGTIVIKVFDYHIAKTGLSEEEARRNGFDPVSCYVSEYDKERYISGSKIINIKMTACRKTKKLLGVQIVGKGDVAKRIDIAAMVISKNGKVEDILSVDLGYAPYFSNAMGAIIVSANVLQNKLNGLFEGVSANVVQNLLQNKGDECVFLDVRTPQEYEEEKIPGFDLIPLENLRTRIDEILPNRKIILASVTGARSYQAALILKANGFQDVKILEGGLRMWPFNVSRE